MITGYGIIDSDGKKSTVVDYAAIRTGKGSFTERLAVIAEELSIVIEKWQPQEAAIEDVFLGNNASSALKLGQARGVAIAACSLQKMPVAEYATRLVKQNVVGTGGATKLQVQQMLAHLLKIKQPLQADAADALAVAMCHAHCMHSPLNMPVTKTAKRSMRFSEEILHRQNKRSL